MAISDAVRRIGATVLDMLQTRLELAAVEIEEESRRLLGYFVLALLALILFGVAMLLVSLAIILVFWDGYRIEAAVTLAALFGIAAGLIGMKLRADFSSRPRLLAATVGELNKDINFIRNAGVDQ
jgi:uncharacterized membrane protein YqjE